MLINQEYSKVMRFGCKYVKDLDDYYYNRLYLAYNALILKVWLILGISIALAIIFNSNAFAGQLKGFTDKQVELIAVILSAEACGDGKQGLEAVASTMLNRAKLRKTDPFIEATRKNQYYGMTAKNRLRLYNQCKATAQDVATRLLNGTLKDTVNGGIYFINPKYEKPFKWCKVKTARVGSHVFYK